MKRAMRIPTVFESVWSLDISIWWYLISSSSLAPLCNDDLEDFNTTCEPLDVPDFRGLLLVISSTREWWCKASDLYFSKPPMQRL